MMVLSGVRDLEDAHDRDDVTKYRHVMEAKLKVAKAYSPKYRDKAPSTAVQINNYGEEGELQGPPALLNIIGLESKDELPPLEEHNHIIEGESEYVPVGLDDIQFREIEE